MLVQFARFNTIDTTSFERILVSSGVAVRPAVSVGDALEHGIDEFADLIVLFAPPFSDVSSTVSRLKQLYSGQSIVVTSLSSDAEERAKHLNAGADDHISTNADPIEIVARLVAITRQRYGHFASAIKVGSVEIDIEARTAIANGHAISLTRQEFQLLELLALHGEAAVSFDTISAVLSNDPADPTATSRNAINLCVSRLRQKLKTATSGDVHIDPVRGTGYALRGCPTYSRPWPSSSVH